MLPLQLLTGRVDGVVGGSVATSLKTVDLGKM